MAASGLARLTVPAAYGGEHETVDPYAVCKVREALMGTCSHADSLFALQGIGSHAIAVGGSPEQKERWLPAVAALDAIAALALTEPDAGSDLKAIKTTVVQHREELVISGYKSYISNAGAADFYTTMAREGGGYSLVVVPADTAGVSVCALPPLIAPHVIGDVSFEESWCCRSAPGWVSRAGHSSSSCRRSRRFGSPSPRRRSAWRRRRSPMRLATRARGSSSGGRSSPSGRWPGCSPTAGRMSRWRAC